MGRIGTLILLFFSSVLYAGSFLPVKKNNLMLYMPMTDNEGTQIRDQSSYQSTGTLIGNVAWVKDPGSYAQAYGTSTWAPTIDGATYLPELSGVRLETAPTLRYGFDTADFSVAWVMSFEKNNNTTDILTYVGPGSCPCGGGKCGWWVWNSLGKLQIGTCGSGNGFGNFNFPDFKFTHFWAFTRTGLTVRIYMDGKKVDTVTLNANFGNITSASPLNLGDPVLLPGNFVGKFGAVAIWNTMLTDDDVATMYQSQFGRVE